MTTKTRMRFAVREVGPFDLPAVAALHAACFADGRAGEVWSEAAIGRILALPGAYGLFAAVAPGPAAPAGPAHPVGFLLGRAGPDDEEILSLGVPEAWRRRGAGRALLRAAVERAASQGAQRVLLEAAEDNAAARGLYATEGFAVIARRPAYYRCPAGGTAAALVFARTLARAWPSAGRD